MSAEVRAKQQNLCFEVFVPDSERAKSCDLHDTFESFIAEGKGIEATWVISDWIITRITYHFQENKDTDYGDGGFSVSNIAPVDVEYFLKMLATLCEKLGLKLVPAP
jgi:hypothetical protein